jgi:CobQ-like glutamine amidotransferase family enzyme
MGLYKGSTTLTYAHGLIIAIKLQINHALWTPVVGELLDTEIDLLNPYDKFAVAIKQSHLIVGHIPREQKKREKVVPPK